MFEITQSAVVKGQALFIACRLLACVAAGTRIVEARPGPRSSKPFDCIVYTEGLECLRRWRRSLAVYKLCCLQ